MPTALVTTKRKFQKILDSISNASDTSLASISKHNASISTLPATLESPAKRTKLIRPISTCVTASKRIVPLSTPNTRLAEAAKQSGTGSTQERTEPNFAPWDRNRFLDRLETFRHVDKWMSKPDAINEVQWAKRGWSCVGRETVECMGGCGKRIVVLLEAIGNRREIQEERDQAEEDDEEEWREKALEQLVEKYATMIASEHDGGCLWRRKGCDETIQRLPLVWQATAVEALCARYRSLLVMADELPANISAPETFDVTKVIDRIADRLQSSSSTRPNSPSHTQQTTPHRPVSPHQVSPSSPASINSDALILALFGWQAEEGHISGLATCKACFRRLGLWLFKPSVPNETSIIEHLDVVGEHRNYCPWISAASQCGTEKTQMALDGLSGWEILYKGILARGRFNEQQDAAQTHSPSRALDDHASEVSSVMSAARSKEEREVVERQDKERWTKLKQLKKVFHVRKDKMKAGAVRKKPEPSVS